MLIMVFLALCSLASIAQKIERESKIKKNEVPEKAIEWSEDAFEGIGKIKWFREISSESEGAGNKESYEAKLYWKGKYHSVEFDKNGNIEDIEIIYSWQDLSEGVREKLEEYFKAQYDKYKIEKIQIQYTGSSDNLEDIIDEEEFEDITTRYEIVYYGKNSENKYLWEGLFNEAGEFIEKSRVIQRPTDNLNY